MKKLIHLFVAILISTSYSCDNEPLDISSITADDAFGVNSELYDSIERIADDDPDNNLVCLDFIYAFTVNVFDENLDYVGLYIVNNDLEFSTLLGGLQENYSISVSYPITSVTDDGETVEITTNEELKEIIDLCLEEEVLNTCNGMLTEDSCVWKVVHNENGNNDFENAYFEVSTIGTVVFHHEDNAYDGTWITFFIENELHLNISLQNNDDVDDTNVIDNWNFDWKATILDFENMKLENEDSIFFIQKECEVDEEDCNAFEFEACELNEGEGIAEFLLEDYIECFTNYIEYETSENTIVTFYEDESNDTPLETVPYLNTTNPQFIYVKIEDGETSEIVSTSIKLTAIECE